MQGQAEPGQAEPGQAPLPRAAPSQGLACAPGRRTLLTTGMGMLPPASSPTEQDLALLLMVGGVGGSSEGQGQEISLNPL